MFLGSPFCVPCISTSFFFLIKKIFFNFLLFYLFIFSISFLVAKSYSIAWRDHILFLHSLLDAAWFWALCLAYDLSATLHSSSSTRVPWILTFNHSNFLGSFFYFFILATVGLHCRAWVFSSCGVRGSLGCRAQAWGCVSSVVVAHRLSCPSAHGIFPDQGSNLCPLHWQLDS